jgi:hypothetical protein
VVSTGHGQKTHDDVTLQQIKGGGRYLPATPMVERADRHRHGHGHGHGHGQEEPDCNRGLANIEGMRSMA